VTWRRTASSTLNLVRGSESFPTTAQHNNEKRGAGGLPHPCGEVYLTVRTRLDFPEAAPRVGGSASALS
jgi:hypothetical protein